MNNIDDLSVFGDYSTEENRLTQALLHVLKIGGDELLVFLCSKLSVTLPKRELIYHSQIKLKKKDQAVGSSVPDGLVKSDYAFSLYIESKLNNSINEVQLANHLNGLFSCFDNSTPVYLLYITSGDSVPQKLVGEKH